MTDYAAILEELNQATAQDFDQTGWKEITVDKTGVPRQSGSTHPEGEFIKQFRRIAEADLHAFGVGVMGRAYLTDHLHLPVSGFLQKVPPFRKLLLMPRDHAKTSIVSHCLPPHILIQPASHNIYFPNMEGSECRILLGGSSAGRAEKNLAVVAKAFTANSVMRAIWPHRCYESEKHAKSEAGKWNAQEIIIPRSGDWPDSSVFAVGVGVEVAGARPNVQIKDDLIGREAANSEAMMRDAIDWHKASRALMDEYEKDSGVESLEFIIGTRWGVFDLYSFILQGDEEVGPDFSVEVLIRRILEKDEQTGDLNPIWPERFPPERIDQLRREFGTMFYLLYMNEASDPSLVDFDMSQVRQFKLGGETGSEIMFDPEKRDDYLEAKFKAKPEEYEEPKRAPQGIPLNADTWDMFFGKGRGQYMRLKYG
jgi:hypothetical protein